MVTAAKNWQGKIQVEGSDLDLPSGNTARVRQMSPQAFLDSGLIPDPLTNMIRKAINDKQGLPPSAMKEMSDDPTQLSSALEMIDRVTEFVVIEPEVEMPPTCIVPINGPDDFCGEYANTDIHIKKDVAMHHKYKEGPRDKDVLYVDQILMEDKIFLLQWCMGGTRDLEKFREEQLRTVESVQNSKAVRRPAKRTAGRK